MDYWIPDRAADDVVFRKSTRLRQIFDVGARSARWWVFQIADAYLPRKQIWPGDDLAVRFSIHNHSAQEGVVYYIVTVRHAYGNAQASTDELPDRAARIAWVPAGAPATIQTLIPSHLLQRLRCGDTDEMTLSVEIELWVPRRARMERTHVTDRLMTLTRSGRFHKVALFANPTVLYRRPATDAFVSYAWAGADRLPSNAHRAWVYAFADALAQSDVQAIVDYSFLSPKVVTNEVIVRSMDEAAHVVIVYSDAYLERIDREGTGVSLEYGLIRAKHELWSKSLPIRRDVYDRERELYSREERFVLSFERDDLATATSMLARHMHAPVPVI